MITPMALCGLRTTAVKPPSSGDSKVLERRGDVAGIPATKNPFVPLESEEQNEEETPDFIDSEGKPVDPGQVQKEIKAGTRMPLLPEGTSDHLASHRFCP